MQEEFSEYVKKIVIEVMTEENIEQNLDESNPLFIEKYNEIERILTENGTKAFYEERREIIILLKKELLGIGMSLEDVDLFIKTETEKNDARYRDEIKGFPKESKEDFGKFFIEKQKEQLKLTKQDFFEYKASKILDSKLLKTVNVKQDTFENKNKGVEKYKSEIWFKVGLLFAKGEMNKYYNANKTGFKEGYSAPKVASELKQEGYNKFILATINNYSSKLPNGKNNPNGNKNIFNSKQKMEMIIKHCDENQIIIDDYFLSKLPKE